MKGNDSDGAGQPGTPIEKMDISRSAMTLTISGVLLFMGIVALVIVANQPDSNACDAKCHDLFGHRDSKCAADIAAHDLAAGL
jgi:hypothetical protein